VKLMVNKHALKAPRSQRRERKKGSGWIPPGKVPIGQILQKNKGPHHAVKCVVRHLVNFGKNGRQGGVVYKTLGRRKQYAKK